MPVLISQKINNITLCILLDTLSIKLIYFIIRLNGIKRFKPFCLYMPIPPIGKIHIEVPYVLYRAVCWFLFAEAIVIK